MKKNLFLLTRSWFVLLALSLWVVPAWAADDDDDIIDDDEQITEIDCTDRIKNYNFMTNGYFSTDGWTMYRRYNTGSMKECPSSGGCMEYWNPTVAQRSFDMYQELTGLDNGKYVLRASMWYRGTDKACGVYASNAGNAEVFVGSETVASGNDAEQAASRKEYETRSIVVYDGTLRIGAKNRGAMGSDWFGLDYIKLIKVGEASADELKQAESNAKLTQKMLAAPAQTDLVNNVGATDGYQNFGKYQSVYDEIYRADKKNFCANKDIIYYELTDLQPGTYRVNFYAIACCARNKNNIKRGNDKAWAFANSTAKDISVEDHFDGVDNVDKANCAPTNNPQTLIAEVGSDGKLRYGIKNIAEGGQWYVIKSISLQKISTISDCLCFTSPGYAQICFANVNDNTLHDFEYSIDGEIWEDYVYAEIGADNTKFDDSKSSVTNKYSSSKSDAPSLTTWASSYLDISHNQKVYFRAKERTGMLSEGNDLYFIDLYNGVAQNERHRAYSRYAFYYGKKNGKNVDNIYASGNVMSLIDPYCQMTEVPKTCFSNLFVGMDKLVTAPRLPATSISPWCYEQMFMGCSSLEVGPTIAATVYYDGSCSSMFNGCKKLRYVDISFRNNWTNSFNMFNGRDGNSTPCVLYCYRKDTDGKDMNWYNGNYNWSNFNVTKIYKDGDGMADYLCFTNIGSSAASIQLQYKTNKSKDFGIQYSRTGYSDWTDVNPAAAIALNTTDQARLFFRAKTGQDNSVDDTFDASNYLQFVMSGRIAASGDIGSLLKGDCTATELPHHAFYHLFDGCTALEQAPALNFSTLSVNCYEGMFKNCVKLSVAPELPATELKSMCYKDMFNGCSNLCMITSNFAEWDPDGVTTTTVDPETGEEIKTFTANATNATYNWVKGVMRDSECRFMNDQIKELIYDDSHIPCDEEVQWYVGDANYLTFTARNAASYVKLNAVGITWSWSGTYSEDKMPFVKLDYRTKAEGDKAWSNWKKYTFPNMKNEDGDVQSENLQIDLEQDEMVQFRAGSILQVNSGSKKYNYFYPANNKTFSKGTKDSKGKYCEYYQFEFSPDGGDIEASGNISSLLSYNCANEAVPEYAYCQLFLNCSKLTKAPELPSTIMGKYCYCSMFDYCSNLTEATALPAIQLAPGCYYRMYAKTKIKEAPTMPATQLAASCYRYMFSGCGSLKSVGSLNATQMEANCYQNMFYYCSNLKKAPALISKQLAKECYKGMFEGCSKLEEAPILPATALKEGCYNGMFKSCTRLVSAPDLPAETLQKSCYAGMFNGCTRLKKISVQFTDWNAAGGSTTNWVTGVPEKGNFVCPEDLSTADADFNENRVPKDATHHWNVIKNPYVWFMAEDENGGKVQLKKNGTLADPKLEYSTTGVITDWHDYNNFNQQISLTEIGDIVMFRAKVNYSDCGKCGGTGEDGGNTCATCKGQKKVVSGYETNNSFSTSTDDYFQFVTSGNLNLNGDVSSLINGEYHRRWSVPGFVQEIPNNYAFYGLFKDNKNLTGKADLSFIYLLPHCYQSIFENCEKLSSAPDLPATYLKNKSDVWADYCYEAMFKNCKSITDFPEMRCMPMNDRLSTGCFKDMFYGCTSLKNNMPESLIPYNSFPSYACYGMFENCTALKTAPAMMGSAIDFKDGTTGCFARMFAGCTNLKTAVMPYLQKIDQTVSICESMYEGCTQLTIVPTLPTASSRQYGEATFRNTYKGCTNLKSAPTLPCVLGDYCFEGMFENTGLLNAPVLGQTTLRTGCYKRMFADCKNLSTAPELPATTLTDYCYYEMFENCTSLRYMDVGFSSNKPDDASVVYWSAEQTEDQPNYTYHWVNNVAPTGTFMAPSGLLKKYDKSHIPFGWRAEDNGDYFCITVTNDNYTNVKILSVGGLDVKSLGLKISFDKDTWYPYSPDDGIHLKTGSETSIGTTGDHVFFKATGGSLSQSDSKYFYITAGQSISASGDIMSLIDASMQSTTVPDYTFYKFFSGMTALSDVSTLKLPATTVGSYAYAEMFNGCETLQSNATVAPALPATTLGTYCYENLFNGWKKLETAPKLPATTLVEGCYNGLFQNCISLSEMNVSFTEWVQDAIVNWVDNVADEGEFYCLSDLLANAVKPVEQGGWGSDNECANIYGPSRIPKDAENPWVIVLDVNVDFDYSSNKMILSGGENMFYCEDPAVAPTTADELKAIAGYGTYSSPVDMSGWVNAATDLSQKTIYAVSTLGTSIPTKLCRSIVRNITIYAYPKYHGYCLATDADLLEKSLFYGEKTSSANHPVFIFVPNGEIDMADKASNLVVGNYVSLIGQSVENAIIRKDVASAAPIDITGNYAYLQDIKLKNANANGYSFYNNGMYNTLNIKMEGAPGATARYMDGAGNTHDAIVPEWSYTGYAMGNYAPVDRVITNGGAINIISDAKTFLVEYGDMWDITDCKVFYIAGGMNTAYTLRAANQYGGFGPYFKLNDSKKVTPVDHDGLTAYAKPLSVTLNKSGFASFYFEEAEKDEKTYRLRAIGASAFVAKIIGRFGDVVLTHINDKDVIPSGTGVILFGQPGTTVEFYEDLDTDVSTYDKYLGSDYNQLTGVTDDWSPNEANRYYGLSGKAFRRLSETGTILANRAFFDCGSEPHASAAVRTVRFADWDDMEFFFDEEQEQTGIQELHYVSNLNKVTPTYNIFGQKTTAERGLLIRDGKVVLVR